MTKRNWGCWWRAAGIRAIRTIAQTALATIGAAMALESVKWLFVLSTSLMAGLLSLLTSIAGLPEAKEKSNGEYHWN